MSHTANQGGGRACDRMATAAVSNMFTSCAILLGVEGKARVSGKGQVLERTCERIEFALPNGERNMLELEGRLVGSSGVFAWAQNEKEAQPGEVHGGARSFTRGQSDACLSMVKDLDG